MEQLLLGIDIGTSACKTALFTLDGRVVSQSTEEYCVYYPGPNCVEQDPREWFDAVAAGIRKIVSGVDVSKIACIGIDGQSWSFIPVDRQGNVLHNALIWMDRRSVKQCEQMKRFDFFELCKNRLDPTYVTPKIVWFKENHPDLYQNTYMFLQSNSYIAMRLTGQFTQDLSQGYGFHFFDMQSGTWNEKAAEQLEIDLTKLPPIYQCHEVIGEVTREAAEFCGLRAGIPVVAGGLDAACGTLGAGVFKAGQTQEQGGQAGGMSICEDKPAGDPALILSHHVVPNLWLLQGGTVGGGSLKWLKPVLAMESFKEMDLEAEKIPAGSEGLIYLPYMAGERSPIWDPDAKGVFCGLSYDKTRGHLIRAALEGCAFALYHNIDVAENAGAKAEELIAMGGAANSRLWTQIKSDVTGKVIRVSDSDTATTLGAAILAGVGTGLYSSFEEAVQRTVELNRVHEPNWENHKIYQERYQIYLEIYEKLKDTFPKM